MPIYQLKIKLLSDTTFGRGDGVAGLIDQEVEHDPFGFPYLRGRTLKGLLSEESDNLIAILTNHRPSWERVACNLFGTLGSTIGTMGAVHVGDACLPEDLRQAVAFQINDEKKLTKTEVLNSLTTIRRHW
ncbi:MULTISPECIES: RAMP superfamily CRISPR-associated protein [unclassified Microcoleus]|uniref:RAMP superfamily CRISPR-associated protein n=1 Tax=unclassified Microcoleus TaxID=2642155 RepID=UPI002FD658BC